MAVCKVEEKKSNYLGVDRKFSQENVLLFFWLKKNSIQEEKLHMPRTKAKASRLNASSEREYVVWYGTGPVTMDIITERKRERARENGEVGQNKREPRSDRFVGYDIKAATNL